MLLLRRASCLKISSIPRLVGNRLRKCPSRLQLPYRRAYATSSSLAQRYSRTIDIRVGGNGSIKLDICLPANNAAASETSKGPVLVYLPPGPRPKQTTSKTASNILTSLISKNTTLVTINYRLSPASRSEKDNHDHRFPSPIHDVCVAWSYITSHLFPPSDSSYDGNAEIQQTPKISLMGTNIGGSLATMLALTQPNDVYSLAVTEPLVDWVGIDEIAVSSGKNPNTSPHSRKKQARNTESMEAMASAAQDLIRLRSTFFRNPSSYFDPFASPMLFLRAPGRDTPLYMGPGLGTGRDGGGSDDSFGPYDDDWQPSPARDDDMSGFPTDSSMQDSEGSPIASPLTDEDRVASTRPKRRKVLHRWPRVGQPEDVELPFVKVFVKPAGKGDGHASLMRAQGLELVDLMRRACFFGREEGFAEEKVNLGYLDEKDAGDDDGLRKCVEWIQVKEDEFG